MAKNKSVGMTDVFSIAKRVLIDPAVYFSKLKKDTTIWYPILYYVYLVLFAFIPTTIAQVMQDEYLRSTLESELGLFLQIVFGSLILSNLFIVFVVVPFLHVYMYAAGARVKINKSFQVILYAVTPSVLFGWIPYFNLVALLYSVVLIWYGFNRVHNLSYLRIALALLVVPIVSYAAIALLM